MRNAANASSLPVPEGHDANAFLQDVAAYLRGIADATAALSDARAPALEPEAFSALPRQVGHSSAASGRATRRTMPFGLGAATSDRQERHTVAYLFSQDPDDTPSVVDGIPESWGDEGAAERSSGVFLRAKRLSPEWFELVGAAVS
jgi:hypothetical protein